MYVKNTSGRSLLMALIIFSTTTQTALGIEGSSPSYSMQAQEAPQESTSESYRVVEPEVSNSFPTIGASPSYSMCGEMAGENTAECNILPPPVEEDNGEPEEEESEENNGQGGNQGNTGGGSSSDPTPHSEEDDETPTQQWEETQEHESPAPDLPWTLPLPSPTVPTSPATPGTADANTSAGNKPTSSTTTQDAATGSVNLFSNDCDLWATQLPGNPCGITFGPWPRTKTEVINIGEENATLLHEAAIVASESANGLKNRFRFINDEICYISPYNHLQTPWNQWKIGAMLTLFVAFNTGVAIYILSLILSVLNNAGAPIVRKNPPAKKSGSTRPTRRP